MRKRSSGSFTRMRDTVPKTRDQLLISGAGCAAAKTKLSLRETVARCESAPMPCQDCDRKPRLTMELEKEWNNVLEHLRGSEEESSGLCCKTRLRRLTIDEARRDAERWVRGPFAQPSLTRVSDALLYSIWQHTFHVLTSRTR